MTKTSQFFFKLNILTTSVAAGSSRRIVSVWAEGLRLVLAQTKVEEKSNEITAIPEVLKLLAMCSA